MTDHPPTAGLDTRETETIGRFPHLLTHISSQLPALAEGDDTFEAVRLRYGSIQSSLARRGLARVTAPRAGIRVADRYWSSTRDLIKELQTLGWVDPEIPVPSRRSAVDAHRDRRYRLTPEGERVAALTANRRELADELTTSALEHHPYLRALLKVVDEGPLFCPEVGEGQVVKNSSRRHWAERAAELFERSDPRVRLSTDELDAHLERAMRRRFGRRRAEGEQPVAKEVVDALNAAFADASLEAHGLRFGSTTLDALCGWGMQLRLLDQSRYVPGHDGGNLLWLCSDLQRDTEGRLHASRRAFPEYGDRVASALVDSYFELRSNPDSGEADRRTGTYQMIHVVRAAAAFRTGTARELGDRALEALAANEIDLGVQVRLQAARFEKPPRSEPMYERAGTRALTLSMTRGNGVSAAAKDQTTREKEKR